jgi:hypothetical protein
MRSYTGLILSLWVGLGIGFVPTSLAGIDDMPTIIERFVSKQFPNASSHFWVLNGAPQQEKNEVVVDINTVVTMSADRPPAEDRFLLLIVSGKLAAAQRIPLDGETICQTET